jgi:inner membrane protein
MQTHQTETNSNTKKFIQWFKTSITAQLVIMGALSLLLMIPLSLIQDLINERETRQKEVVSELNDKWGNDILLYGPILKVPYKTHHESVQFDPATQETFTKQNVELKYAYFFPKTLDLNAAVQTTKKKRNMFKTTVFTATIDASGNFETPDFSIKSIPEEAIVWEKATLLLQTNNLKGLKSEVKFNVNGNSYNFEPQPNATASLAMLESSFLALEDVPNTAQRAFDFKLLYNGSKSIRFIPIGKLTNVKMTSNWKDPKHSGSFITQSKRVTDDGGFEATWKLLHTNRSFAQQYFKMLPDLSSFAFGTDFIIPVDEYQQSERSAKYGFLVIGLTFLVFFLIQTLSKISIHPFQYLMIGIALVMFYTLLISISEHSSFLYAYLIAGISVIVMITLYSKSILKYWKFPFFIGSTLTALYSFIYVIIQLENYALLVGSIGLFLILGIVMYVSRKIDWNYNEKPALAGS